MLSIIDSTEVVDWPTVKDVAQILDYTEEHVRRLVRARQLSASPILALTTIRI